MFRQVSGTLVAYTCDRELSVCAQYLLEATQKHLPQLDLTHFSVSETTSGRYRQWSEPKFLEAIAKRGVETVTLLAFSDPAAARDKVRPILRLSVEQTSARGPDCNLIGLLFDKDLIRSARNDVLALSDHLAVQFSIESGNLHDLEDISDQNQLGPHWFKVTGRPLDPKKIKYSELLQEEIVDREQNPCHIHVVEAIDFTAAWTNYLGPEFLRLVPRKALTELDADIHQLGDELYRVTLFDDPFACTEPENVEKLWNFRRRLRIDEVAHRFDPPL